ncbi:plasmid partitioning protein RepB [Xinfangfangia sp. CPCC 101601]|uniref:Plasmid partitioning protein RepB n=1 Tax=Pseudogemmobacter lacusdianii TaxID=3069608 RepID=A0ABU0W1Y7_9RHOB|nr:plasmid partitioning protein RepB [Xinfangfangia sp. CPCC 101601]MDQ2068034.1 plasmid partitioning protein RepB [Xinfangfangia sp. CPCC 101601]
MARKVFGSTLKKAMDQGVSLDAIEAQAVQTRTSPTVTRAQASVIEEDKHATRLLDPNLIRMSAVQDRLDPSDGLEELVESIKEHGQKVAILVRRLADGAYEIVYGRRRLLACRELGQKVRATVMELSDEEALIAQGVENNARQDPSFIERAVFVSGIIAELGKTEETRKNAQTVAYRALQIDESLVSRMHRIASAIPMVLIRAIGPAHGSGRRVWEKLAKLCEATPDLAGAVANGLPKDLASAERLELAINRMSPPPAPATKPASSDRITIKRKGNKITLEADPMMLPKLEDAVRNLVAELLDRGQEEAPEPATSTATPS